MNVIISVIDQIIDQVYVVENDLNAYNRWKELVYDIFYNDISFPEDYKSIEFKKLYEEINSNGIDLVKWFKCEVE